MARSVPVNWMQSTLSIIGDRPLRSIAMPGSHDAGMSVIEGKTAFVTDEDVLTQTGNIGSQLQLGSRYFDLRPVIASGQFKTGHYSKLDIVGWQGADGQAFSEIISELNAFTANNAELIVLNLSHDQNTDSGYGALTQTDCNNLFQQMTGINHLFVAPNPTSIDLTSMTVNQFIGGGQAAVLVIIQPSGSGISLGSFACTSRLKQCANSWYPRRTSSIAPDCILQKFVRDHSRCYVRRRSWALRDHQAVSDACRCRSLQAAMVTTSRTNESQRPRTPWQESWSLNT